MDEVTRGFGLSTASEVPDKVHIHVRCFAPWEFERDGQADTPMCDGVSP
jgi:hypothetical protein